MRSRTVVAAALCIGGSASIAQPYRCAVDGKTVYQQTPCPGGVAVNIMGAGQADLNSQAALQSKREVATVDQQRRVDVAVANGRIFVGMNADDVVRSWGRPTKINQTLTGRGSSEQWVYRREKIGDDQYVYLDNGVVTSIQTPR